MTGNYILITPARNEEDCVERPLRSVVAQTILPKKWVIVSDGSTDRTDDIVREYTAKYSFIELVRAGEQGVRNFGSKVAAFNAGYARVAGMEYEFIGNLDADVSFAPEYFETLLSRFSDNQSLGLGGGIIMEKVGDRFVPQTISTNSVAGAVQLFRRRCFEDFGGYIPLKAGGIDSAAEIMARMHGWNVQTFADLEVLHHRRVSIGKGKMWTTHFQKGKNDYQLGYHPLFEAMRCSYRMADKPYLIGGLTTFTGYAWAWMRGYKFQLPGDVVQFLRTEQITRLKSGLRKTAQPA